MVTLLFKGYPLVYVYILCLYLDIICSQLKQITMNGCREVYLKQNSVF